jgi:hypothetical protein
VIEWGGPDKKKTIFLAVRNPTIMSYLKKKPSNNLYYYINCLEAIIACPVRRPLWRPPRGVILEKRGARKQLTKNPHCRSLTISFPTPTGPWPDLPRPPRFPTAPPPHSFEKPLLLITLNFLLPRVAGAVHELLRGRRDPRRREPVSLPRPFRHAPRTPVTLYTRGWGKRRQFYVEVDLSWTDCLAKFCSWAPLWLCPSSTWYATLRLDPYSCNVNQV